MPKVYNPDTQEVRDAKGNEVSDLKSQGFMTVGNRPEAEYMGLSREEIGDDDTETETEAPATGV